MGQPRESTLTWRHALQVDSALSPFDSPFPTTHPAFKDAPRCSWTRLTVAGLLITVYGLDELPFRTQDVSILWLLHGRGDTQDSMSFVAGHFLAQYYHHLHQQHQQQQQQQQHRKTSPGSSSPPGLLCVTLDQRNHGSRLVDHARNLSWNQGNATHGPDMFGSYTGTAADVSHLIPLLAAHLPSHLRVTRHLACGLSLGAHAVWTLLLADPRVRAGVAIVGCPDYVRLMTDRAVRAKRPSCMQTDPPGRDFLGSRDFPRALVEDVELKDPAGLLLGELDVVTGEDWRDEPGVREKERLDPILEGRLSGKRMFCVGGGKDRLVPVEMGRPLLTWLKAATDREKGWARGVDFEVRDYVDPEARHECSVKMREAVEKWLVEYLLGEEDQSERQSKL